jgi:AAA family ATP:ADP antiporter
VFYVWVSAFALFVVSVFWGFVADVFDNDQARRLFGFITVGASLGGIAGSSVTALLAERIPVFALLVVAIVPLEVAARLARGLHLLADRGGATLRREGAERVGGSAWSGIGPVFRSPYLRRIAIYLTLMTFSSTILYFQQANIVAVTIADRAARTALLARLDLAVNVLTIATQGLLTAHIIRRIGVGPTLALVPAATLLGFLGMGVHPVLAVMVAVQVLYRSGRYAVAKPAREVLFTLVPREQRFKSKAFIDNAVYRGGDLVSGWIYAGLAAVGLSVGAISLLAAPAAAAWVGLGLALGRMEERARRAQA